jgi:predicted CDP-diglyceride synthetase/phosphatidate cytidylyltransferase
MMHFLEWGLLPLFSLAKDVDGVLQLYEPCSLQVYMLPSSIDALGHCLSPYDGFLFLMEPLNLLLDSEQLLLFNSLISRGFFLPVLQLDLFELRISLDDLNWRGCPWR